MREGNSLHPPSPNSIPPLALPFLQPENMYDENSKNIEAEFMFHFPCAETFYDTFWQSIKWQDWHQHLHKLTKMTGVLVGSTLNLSGPVSVLLHGIQIKNKTNTSQTQVCKDDKDVRHSSSTSLSTKSQKFYLHVHPLNT